MIAINQEFVFSTSWSPSWHIDKGIPYNYIFLAQDLINGKTDKGLVFVSSLYLEVYELVISLRVRFDVNGDVTWLLTCGNPGYFEITMAANQINVYAPKGSSSQSCYSLIIIVGNEIVKYFTQSSFMNSVLLSVFFACRNTDTKLIEELMFLIS